MRNPMACLIAVIVSAVLTCAAGCSHTGRGGLLDASGEPLRFAFIATCVDEDFFKPVKKGMADAAAKMGVKCIFVGTPEVDLKAQAEMVRKALADGYDGIAVCLIDAEAFDGVVAEAMDKGIPVVAFNTDDNRTPNRRLSAVCQDLYKAGRSVGERALEFIPDNSKILMTVHSDSISALEDRLRGEQDVLKERGVTWKRVVTGTTPEGSAEVITAALKEDPEIKVVLCTGQADTEGAGLAIEKHFAGKGYAAAGFDLSPQILRLIKTGHIRFTIDQQPYIQGFYPVVQLALYCRYGIRPSNVDVGATVISADNVNAVVGLSAKGYR
ncbi:MAG: sugar ABC transporter substrate-binding protein [Phycisphaerae bacterium]|nr:sugar ABC transporter substrate-binding protein [Phycisphaerae bacterium]